MKVVFVRTKTASDAANGAASNGELNDAGLKSLKLSPKAGSSSKNIIRGLERNGFIQGCEEWKFWSGPSRELALPGLGEVRFFPAVGDEGSDELDRHIRDNGPPDVLWVEGRDYPPHIQRLFEACPQSFKIVYSKHWRPWKIQGLERYDLCLVDEAWQVKKVRKACPTVQCAVWDKLIDYDQSHRPLTTPKKYDICYVAYLRERKNHNLLFQAMAKVKDLNPTCVCVGADRRGYQAELEKLVSELDLSVRFTGEVSYDEVNSYVSQSRIGVLCSRLDAAPRAILEYLAADVPVLVNSDLLAGARYVGKSAGLIVDPDDFPNGLRELLINHQAYTPRDYYLANFSFEKVMDRFMDILARAGFDPRYARTRRAPLIS